MPRLHLDPPGMFRHPAFTRIVAVDAPARVIYFAGQTATDADNNIVGKGDYLAQYRCIMELLTRELELVGATWDDVVFKRQYTLDIVQYRAATNHPDNPPEWDGRHKAPSTLLGVNCLAQPDFLIEIEIVAMVDQ